MEAELLWPRVWQMACRLEEIPQPHDFVEYEFLDQSVIVLRTDDHGRARVPERVPPSRRQGRRGPRDVRAAGSRARSTGGATASTARTPSSRGAKTFAEHNLQPGDIDLVPVRCEVWGGCAWINLDDDAPPLRQCMEPAATILDAWKVGVAADRVVVRVPAPGELEARRTRRSSSSTTSWRRIPQLRIPACGTLPPKGAVRRARVHRRGHPLPAHDERRHGRHGARERRARRREPARHRAARRPGARDRDVEPRAQRRGRRLAPRRGLGHPRPQRPRRAGPQRDRWATASRTTSCCRCTAARPRTASARSDRRRR